MAKEKYEDAWDQLEEDLKGNNNYDKNTIITCKQEKTYLHLYSLKYLEGYLHFIQLPNGQYRRVVCGGGKAGKGNDPENCRFCKIREEAGEKSAISKRISNARKSHKYYLLGGEAEIKKKKVKGKVRKKYVLPKEASPVEIGPMIMGEIAKIRRSIKDDQDGSWEDLGVESILDVIIKVTQYEEKGWTKYSASASPKYVPVPEDVDLSFDLTKFIEMPDEEEVEEILTELGVLEDSAVEEEEGWDEDVIDEEVEDDDEEVEDDDEEVEDDDEEVEDEEVEDEEVEDEDDDFSDLFEDDEEEPEEEEVEDEEPKDKKKKSSKSKTKKKGKKSKKKSGKKGKKK